MRKDAQHSIRKVACCQLKLNVAAASAEPRIGSHASGLVLSSKEPGYAFKNGQNQRHGYSHSSASAAVLLSTRGYVLFCVRLVSSHINVSRHVAKSLFHNPKLCVWRTNKSNTNTTTRLNEVLLTNSCLVSVHLLPLWLSSCCFGRTPAVLFETDRVWELFSFCLCWASLSNTHFHFLCAVALNRITKRKSPLRKFRNVTLF